MMIGTQRLKEPEISSFLQSFSNVYLSYYLSKSAATLMQVHNLLVYVMEKMETIYRLMEKLLICIKAMALGG